MVNGSYNYDFALIEMHAAAKLSSDIRTICLPDLPIDLCKSSADMAKSYFQRENCLEFYAAGWGSTDRRFHDQLLSYNISFHCSSFIFQCPFLRRRMN